MNVEQQYYNVRGRGQIWPPFLREPCPHTPELGFVGM
jgi:hypothetical protein